MASASARLNDIGFSAKMALTPDWAQSMTMAARGFAEVVTLTMSGRSRSSISR